VRSGNFAVRTSSSGGAIGGGGGGADKRDAVSIHIRLHSRAVPQHARRI